MSFAELKEAADHVTEGQAKLGEVIYGDDGIDMALDIDAVIGIVRDLASKKPPAYNGTCLLCHFADEDEVNVNHSAECPYRRAVEMTR